MPGPGSRISTWKICPECGEEFLSYTRKICEDCYQRLRYQRKKKKLLQKKKELLNIK